MTVDKKSMALYLVTDRTWLNGMDLAVPVEAALRAGVTFLQLREKHLEFDALVEEGKRIAALARQYAVPFVLNDNIEAALACGADGVHLGQSDLGSRPIRSLLGADKILGISAGTVEQALAAEQAGADYLGVGAVFPTSTKQDANAVSRETLQAICAAVSIPVVAIGGISGDNITQLEGSGANGAAVISAILAQPDVYAAAKRLKQLAGEVFSQ